MNLFNKGYILWISSKLTEIILKNMPAPTRTVPDGTFCRKNNAESISEAEYARRKKYASCAGIPGIHGLVQSVCTRGNFPVLRTQCAFHGMSFLVSLRIYVWRLFYRPRRKPGNCLHALFLSQRFYRCRRLRNYFTCQTRCDNFHDLWRQY